jgi:hypothetical protein
MNMKPEEGMDASLKFGTDKYAGEVIDVLDEHTLRWRFYRYEALHTSMNEPQKWELFSDMNREIKVFTLRANGKWIEKGHGDFGPTLILGSREHFRDYDF